MLLAFLDVSRKYIFGDGEGKFRVSEIGFGGRALRSVCGFEVWRSRARRLKITSSCISNGDVLIRHLNVVAS